MGQRIRIFDGKKYYIFGAYRKQVDAERDASALKKKYYVRVVKVEGGYVLYRRDK